VESERFKTTNFEQFVEMGFDVVGSANDAMVIIQAATRWYRTTATIELEREEADDLIILEKHSDLDIIAHLGDRFDKIDIKVRAGKVFGGLTKCIPSISQLAAQFIGSN